MKEYWFVLDAYVFLWSDEKEVLVYNSLSGKGFIYSLSKGLSVLIEALRLKENLYSVSINDDDLENKDIHHFIFSLRENFCGDIFAKSEFPQKPIVFVPELNINEDVNRDPETLNNNTAFGEHVVRNLTDLVIELTGICGLSCPDCEHSYKQILWCHKNHTVLSFDKLESIFSQVKHTNVFEIKFIGGDIFSYPDWLKLMPELDKLACKKSFYFNYRLFENKYNEQTNMLLKKDDACLNVLIDLPQSLVDNFIPIPFDENRIEYSFKVSSIEDYHASCSIIEQFDLHAKILPFYTGDNLEFFENNIFQTKDDILATQWHKNEVFSHQVLNTNDFGKLTFRSNGEIFANSNFSPIGVIGDELKQLVHKELKNGVSWRRTRDQLEGCNVCLYKYLCPSPSNYELVIGKSALCHVK